jgi:hypothetical protein
VLFCNLSDINIGFQTQYLKILPKGAIMLPELSKFRAANGRTDVLFLAGTVELHFLANNISNI